MSLLDQILTFDQVWVALDRLASLVIINSFLFLCLLGEFYFDAEYCCIFINILKLYFGMQLSYLEKV